MKNVVITGANRGIGLELTKRFAEDNFVYALCRSDFPDVEHNDNIKNVKLDITDEAAITDFANELDDAQIAIDLLINNAGMAGGDEDEKVRLNAEALKEVFNTNIIGPMILTLNLTEALKRAKHPVMIAISSRMGTHELLDDYNAEWWPYSASKAALSLAVSAYAINEPEIKSISIHPGWVKTRMGGDDADISPADSAKGIINLYNTIQTLEPGKLYSYDGKLMNW